MSWVPGDPALQGVGMDDLQKFLPTLSILGYSVQYGKKACDSNNHLVTFNAFLGQYTNFLLLFLKVMFLGSPTMHTDRMTTL